MTGPAPVTPVMATAQVIRVALERRGILGFIEVRDPTLTLLGARALIWDHVEHAPPEFHFVLGDGTPVSARQEHTQRIVAFTPCVTIREVPTTPATPTTMQSPTSRRASGGGGVGSPCASASSSSSTKISVWTPAGDEFAVWIADDYTFQQLRRDAARYWSMPPQHVALVDADGCLWPEQARVLSVMSVDELLARKVILETRGGGPPPGGTGLLAHGRRATASPSQSFSPSSSQAWRQSRRSSLDSMASPKPPMPPSSLPSSHARSMESASVVEELWLIFTFYCINGDTLDLECIRAKQFRRLLRDARLLGAHGAAAGGGAGSSITPAMADIIYTAETKGKPTSSGKMTFDEFLNALLQIALARDRRQSRHLRRTAREDDALLQALVTERILPLAARWPATSTTWVAQTTQLRDHELVAFVTKFLEPLLDIYAFYAKTHTLSGSTTGAKEFYMSYPDYQRFINDFAIASLQISSIEAAQVFLAACLSPPIHEALARRGATTLVPPPTANDDDPDGDTSRNSSSTNSAVDASEASATALTAFIQRRVNAAEGVVLYAPAASQVGRLCLSFSAFLDVLGRLGLASIAKNKTIKPLQAVKAVYHHLSRGLTRSRVMGILDNHGSTSIHAAKLYSGSVAFCNRFLDMWRCEGSPDYLTGYGNRGALTDKYPMTTAPVVASGLASSSTVSTPPPAPVSPSRRLTSSAAMFDERVVPNGAGRGREALDRLVRDAFVRRAVQAKNELAQRHAAGSNVSFSSGGVPVHPITTGTDSPSQGVRSNHSDSKSNGDINDDVGLSASLDPRQRAQQSTADPNQVDSIGVDSSNVFTTSSMTSSTSTIDDCVTSPTSAIAAVADERLLYESILLKGGVFKKYGQWGNPHRRFVWCSKDFDGIYWRPINKKNSLSKEGIPVSSLVAVLPGNSARTRYAFMKHLSEEKSLCRCLSLVAEDRRLDLEADSEATRDLWMNAFQFLMATSSSTSTERPGGPG